ncbi:MAG: hypothetical protein AAFU68_02870 [Pseudomonadota bacterium]
MTAPASDNALCISRAELAQRLRYDDPRSSALDRFLKTAGIKAIPNRRGFYYLKHVEQALDRLHGMGDAEPDNEFERWRAKRAS